MKLQAKWAVRLAWAGEAIGEWREQSGDDHAARQGIDTLASVEPLVQRAQQPEATQ
jgi:hypothetical protein